MLDRADAVERECGWADERPTRLEDEARRRQAARRPLAPYCGRDGAHELLDRRLRLVLDVADPEAAADVDEGGRPVELFLAAGGELPELRDRLEMRAAVRELRAHVYVHPFDLQPRVARAGDRSERLVRVEPELRTPVPRSDRFVGLGLDPGRDADEHPSDAGRGRPCRLVERVDRDERSGLAGRAQLLIRLVVPVHDEAWAFDPSLARIGELAERGHVGAEAFLGEQAHHGDVRESLRPVDDERFRRRPQEHPRPLAERRLGVDDEGRPEALGEVRRGKSVELQLTRCHARSGREQC